MAERESTITLRARDETRQGFESAKRNVRDLDRGLGQAQSRMGAFAAFARSSFGPAIAGAFSVAAVVSFGRAVVQAATVGEQSMAKLNAVLRATGDVSGLTRGEIEGLIDELARTTTFDDDAIREGIATLLTFRSVQGETFAEAVRLGTDLSALFGKDLQSAFVQLGRSLDDPIKNLDGLSRVGVVFNAGQREQIRLLTESGRAADAHRVILAALKERTGGLAQEMNQGLNGATAALAKAWDDLLEAFGRTPAISGKTTGALALITDALRFLEEKIASSDRRLQNSMLFAAGQGTPSAPPAETIVGPGGLPQLRGGTLRDVQEANEKVAARQRAAAAAREAEEARRRKVAQEAAEKAAKEEQARRERLQKEDLAGLIAGIDAQVQEYEDGLREQARITEEFYRKKADEEERSREHAVKVFRREVEELSGVAREAERARDVARDVGLTFASAFEDAIVAGGNLRDVLKGLADDLLRLTARRFVTEPALGALDKLFSGGGGILGGLFGGGPTPLASAAAASGIISPFAAGGVMGPRGPVPLRRYAGGGIADSPQLALFGEGSRREAFVPLPDGRAIPVKMVDGGGGAVVVNLNVTTGVAPTVRAELMAMLPRIQQLTTAAVVDARRRGGSVAAAFGG